MDGLKRTRELLSEKMNRALDDLSTDSLEEIRLRVGQAPTVLISGEEQALLPEKLREEDLVRILEKATGASLHAVAEALSEGYLSYRGVRIGVCGRAVLRHGSVTGFQQYSSLALRIPRQCFGICDNAARELAADWKNTLLIAPPGGGKTTALRELIRRLSESGKRVAVADDRNELSATDQTGMQFDLGPHSDVLVGAGKAESCLMLLRSMNPQILAMDEITRPEDAAALELVRGCGVGILASAHGASLSDLRSRPLYRALLDSGMFSMLLFIRGRGSERRYQLLGLGEA